MQKLISKYGLAAHLALVAVAPLFLSPLAVVCLAVLGAVWLVMEPSRYGNETLHDARRRVTHALLADPVLWVMLALVVISLVRALNVGVAMAYDADTGRWAVSDPAFPLLPGSVEGSGYPLLGCGVASLVVILGGRHCLGRAARGGFAVVASALSGLGAYVLAFLFDEGNEVIGAAVACSWLDLSFIGSAFGVYLVLSIIALVSAYESRWLKAMPLAILGISGNALGLFVFAPAAIAAAHLAAALVIFLYSFVYLRVRKGKTAEFKYLVFVGMGLALAFLALMFLFPAGFAEARVTPLLTGLAFPEGFFESRETLSGISARIWQDHPWLGCGYGSFPLALQFYAKPEDWSVVSPLQKTVSNGYWLILAERGVVGAFLLAVPLVLLLVTFLRRVSVGVRLALPHPLAWSVLPLGVVAVAEMLFDVSYLAPGAAVALVSVLSLSAAAFPKEMSSHGR